jgi:hypothetical protein
LESRLISAVAQVLKFAGPILTREEVPDFSECLQVGANAWMHSSGDLDDLANHRYGPVSRAWRSGHLGVSWACVFSLCMATILYCFLGLMEWLLPCLCSCDPNCGLWQEGSDVYLLALRDIAVDDEILFDYRCAA